MALEASFDFGRHSLISQTKVFDRNHHDSKPSAAEQISAAWCSEYPPILQQGHQPIAQQGEQQAGSSENEVVLKEKEMGERTVLQQT